MAPTSRDEIDDIGENEQVFGVLLTLHGLVHLLGASLSFRLFEFDNFEYGDVWPAAGTWPGRLAGTLWTLVALAIVLVGIRLAAGRDVGRIALTAPLVASVALTCTALPSALPGTVVSAAILLAMVVLAARRAGLSRSPGGRPRRDRAHG